MEQASGSSPKRGGKGTKRGKTNAASAPCVPGASTAPLFPRPESKNFNNLVLIPCRSCGMSGETRPVDSLLKPPRFRGYSPGWRRKSYRRPRAGSVVVDEDLAGRVWAVLAGNRRQDRSRGTCSPSLPAPTLVGGGRAASCGRAAAPASGNRECRFRSRADEPTVRAALLLQLRSGSIFAPSWIGAANLRRRLGAANCRRSGSRTSRRRRARAAPNARG